MDAEDKIKKILGKYTVEDEVSCPGSKIRSEGEGKGLDIGQGSGPIGLGRGRGLGRGLGRGRGFKNLEDA